MSAQRRTATKRRSGSRRDNVPAAPAPDSTGNTILDEVSDTVAEETDSVRRGSVAPRVTAEERSRARAEAKANARKNAENPERTGGIAGRIVQTERTAGVRKFYRETMAEIKKVNWPDRDTTRNLVLVVIAVSVALGLLLGGIDYVLFQVFEALP